MSKNIEQVYVANPITSNASTDLMYFGQSPYGAGNDAAMTYANFSLQFGAPYTAAALTEVNDTNVTLTLGGTPATALLHAVSITAGWTGTLSPARGGTGVNNGASTFTVGGNFQMTGAFTFNGTLTGNTAVTFPTSGTLATTSQIPTGAALTEVNDTNVTLTLGGSPTTALVNAASITAGWTGTLSPTRGGTGVNNGASTFTIGGNFQMSGPYTFNGTLTNNTAVTFPTSGTLATTSQIPTGAALTEVNDTNVTLTLGGSPTTALVNAASITAGWTGTLAVGRGGLGISTVPSNGEIPIGNGTNYTAATLTAGTGISIANGAGSITISSTGSSSWVNVTSSTQSMSTNTGYTSSNGGSLVTFTLPAVAAIGDFLEINGNGTGLWTIAQNAGQQIIVGTDATTSGAGGSLSSQNEYDSVRLRCLTANTVWSVVAQQTSGLTVV